MLRAIFELIITLVVVMAARAILGSLFRGFINVAQSGSNTPPRPNDHSPREHSPREKVTVAGELHKDPVCGTYVAESSRFQRRSGAEHFYYCSEECKDKHAVAAR